MLDVTICIVFLQIMIVLIFAQNFLSGHLFIKGNSNKKLTRKQLLERNLEIAEREIVKCEPGSLGYKMYQKQIDFCKKELPLKKRILHYIWFNILNP